MVEKNKEEGNSESLLELVDKGIALQRSEKHKEAIACFCLLYTSPSPRD